MLFLDLTTEEIHNDDTHAIYRITRDGTEVDTVAINMHDDLDEWERLADAALTEQGYQRVDDWQDEAGRNRDTVRVTHA